VAGGAAAARAPAGLPLFDAHLHYSHDAWELVPPRQAAALLRSAGLRTALVSSSNDEGTQKLLAEAPDIVVPVLRPYRTRADAGAWVGEGANSLVAPRTDETDSGGGCVKSQSQAARDASVRICVAATRGRVDRTVLRGRMPWATPVQGSSADRARHGTMVRKSESLPMPVTACTPAASSTSTATAAAEA
jgi:hypothetical protein